MNKMKPIATIEREVRWLEGTWESGNRIQSVFLQRVAARLVELETALAIQDMVIDKIPSEIKLAEERIKSKGNNITLIKTFYVRNVDGIREKTYVCEKTLPLNHMPTVGMSLVYYGGADFFFEKFKIEELYQEIESGHWFAYSSKTVSNYERTLFNPSFQAYLSNGWTQKYPLKMKEADQETSMNK